MVLSIEPRALHISKCYTSQLSTNAPDVLIEVLDTQSGAQGRLAILTEASS